MSRSLYKGPFFQLNLFTNNNQSNNKNKKIVLNKNLIILPKYIDLYVNIYNGHRFINLKIKENMIGYKFGEFLYTRKRFSFKKKNK